MAGAGTGMYAMVRARRIAEAFTPEGLADRLGALALGARLLTEDVRAASEARESALRHELGLQVEGAGAPRALPATLETAVGPAPRRTPDLALAAALAPGGTTAGATAGPAAGAPAGAAPGVDARAC